MLDFNLLLYVDSEVRQELKLKIRMEKLNLFLLPTMKSRSYPPAFQVAGVNQSIDTEFVKVSNQTDDLTTELTSDEIEKMVEALKQAQKVFE